MSSVGTFEFPNNLPAVRFHITGGSFQGLNAWLLVHRDHQSVFGWIQIKTNDIRRFGSKLGISAHAPTSLPTQADPFFAQNPPLRNSPVYFDGFPDRGRPLKPSTPFASNLRRQSITVLGRTFNYWAIFLIGSPRRHRWMIFARSTSLDSMILKGIMTNHVIIYESRVWRGDFRRLLEA